MLRRELPRIGAKRIVPTHMPADMPGRAADSFGPCVPAFGGMEVRL